MLGKIALNYSPNFTTNKRIKKNIKHLIFHYTGMSSESKAIKRLLDENSKVSCHYFIKRNGQIILMVPDLYISWHAGQSNWNIENFLNRNSIGIEISNKGHQFGYQKFSKAQILSLINLCKYLIKKYSIKKNNVNKYEFVNVITNIKNLEKKIEINLSKNQKIIEFSPLTYDYLNIISKKINTFQVDY